MDNRYNFKDCPSRTHTGSLKWDRYPEDILPLWVADMDIETAPEIIEALKRRLDHKVFGYTIPYDSVYDSVIQYLGREHRYAVKKEFINFLPGLVPAINLCCHAFSNKADSIMTATPVYPPFLLAPKFSERELITVPLCLNSEEQWALDFPAMEKAIQPNTKIFILCNPHNPVGRVYSKTELKQLASFCTRHDLILISDEIHCDLIFDSSLEHHVTASLDQALADRTITLMAPSKTYNLPGLACAYSIIENPKLKHQFEKTIRGIITEINCFGYAACEAAYNFGDPWKRALLIHLHNNHNYLQNFLETKIPQIEFKPMQATYLAWLNVEKLKLAKPAEFFEAHGIGLSDGTPFGDSNYLRLNFGCSKDRLSEALERMYNGLIKENIIGHD
jgi:cystathionine beta-lyase